MNFTSIGIDLAWGRSQPDGVAGLRCQHQMIEICSITRLRGDDELMAWIQNMTTGTRAFLAIDAPLVCPNLSGARPVDRLTHQLFGGAHAGAHPSNRTLCARPVEIGTKLQQLGFALGWDVQQNSVSEVYPHPAMVRVFGLDQIIKYKRGPRERRQSEFARYQTLFRQLLMKEWQHLRVQGWDQIEALLSLPWSKSAEDQTDALFCAWISWQHMAFAGQQSEVLGDLETGFILLPRSHPLTQTP